MNQKIGVLIPVYNEEIVIQDTINALLLAGCEEKDIFIVDDCSTDNTSSKAKQLGVNVITTSNNGGKAAAQRFAIQHFNLVNNYDWLIFIDGDTIVDKDFYKILCLAATVDPTVSLYLGQIRSIKNSHIFSASRAVEYAYGQDIVKVGQNNFGVVFVAPGCASMYNTKMLKKLQINSDTLAEDMDLTLQVHRKRGVVKYVPSAIVNTQDPCTFDDYCKQITRWYRGFWQVIQKHNVFELTFKKRRVDWYMILISLDSLILNRLTAVLFFSQIFSFSKGILIDIFIYAVMSMYTSFKVKRLDTLYKWPATYFIGYINFVAFVKSFIEIFVLRKNVLTWNKVKRYSLNSI